MAEKRGKTSGYEKKQKAELEYLPFSGGRKETWAAQVMQPSSDEEDVVIARWIANKATSPDWIVPRELHGSTSTAL